MKKKKLLTALLICTAVSLGAKSFASTHETDVAEVINKTYSGYTTQDNGGAITNTVDAVIKDSTFTGNKADGGKSGGALDINSTSSVTQISNTDFTNNTATFSGGAISQRRTGNTLTITGGSYNTNTAQYEGGAIFAGGKLTVTGAKFDGNKTLSTNFNDNYTTADDGGGAAIFVGSASNTTVSDSTFTNNKSNTVGGAIAVRNDSQNNGSNSLAISGSTFIENEAVKDGGAIASFIDFTVKDTTFDNNNAGRNGGAVSIDFGNPNSQGSNGSNLENVTMTNNTAAGNGGAIYNGQNSIVNVNGNMSLNNAKYGGAIYNETGAKANIGDNSVLSQNTASKHGGAIYNKESEVTIGDNVKLNSNQASLGGAIYGKGDGSVTIGSSNEFAGNTSSSHGGAIYITANQDLTIGDNAKFTDNKANGNLGNGGAIYSYNSSKNNESNKVTIGNNAEFSNNSSANKHGGAIYSGTGTTLEIGTDSTFTNNTANGGASLGGAIYNIGTDMKIGDNAEFTSNKAVQGGAVFQGSDSELTLNNAKFNNNTATGDSANSAGGAIFISDTDTQAVNITNSSFNGNKSDVAGGAILQANGSESVITIDKTTFNNNETGAEGGAIVSDAALNITNSTFSGNKTTGNKVDETTPLNSNGGGGAIFLYDEGKATISASNFENNSSGTYGGAVATRVNSSNDASSLTIENSNFTGNNADINGGAIASYVDATITDTSLTNNSAGEKGGAVWANQNLTVNATDADVVLSGNKAAEGGDIYMNTEASELNMNAAADKSITVASGISGNENGYNLNVAGGGTLDVQSAINNAAMSVDASTLHLNTGSNISGVTSVNLKNNSTLNTMNNKIDEFKEGLITTDGSQVTVAADINLGSGKGDNIGTAIDENSTSDIVISQVNPIGNTLANNVNIDIYEALGLDRDKATINLPQAINFEIMTPIRKLTGSVTDNGLIALRPTGNSYNDFNSAVMVAPVAAQLGGYLNQLNSYDEAFRNMDMYMLMTKSQRQAWKNANKYAAADANLIFDPLNTPYTDNAGWVRPYGIFESVKLKGGPKVSNVAWGSFAGLDSEMYEFKNGWDGMFSLYAGYNGSHQAYQGNSIYQNGGTLGLTGMAYKGNFFTGLTANIGANVADADTKYGSEDFSMLMTGIASKTGYNFELADGKFIIQPNYIMSYSMVNTFDYTNAAGVRINSDPLHAIQFEPGLKFIGNVGNGWQPYAGVSVVMTAMDDTKFKANDTSLPELSVKPYAKYGVGVRKTWGEKFTGFLQAFVTNGGRNGVGLQGGFRWRIGKQESAKSIAPSEKRYIKANVKQNTIS